MHDITMAQDTFAKLLAAFEKAAETGETKSLVRALRSASRQGPQDGRDHARLYQDGMNSEDYSFTMVGRITVGVIEYGPGNGGGWGAHS